MAWISSGSTNASLINNLARNGLITSERVRNAMLAVDRAHYCPTAPYADSPQSIGYSATISAPHMHASAAESLLPFLSPQFSSSSGSSSSSTTSSSRMPTPPRILDIGSGSGYLTAVLAELGGEGAKVVGVEHIPQLVELAEENMRKSEQGASWLREGRVRFVRGDGRAGFVDPEFGAHAAGAAGAGQPGAGEEQWDVIHVGAAAREAHEVLIRQLRRPGRLFIPVGEGGEAQYIWIIDKDAEGRVTRKRDMGVRYVPLTDAPT